MAITKDDDYLKSQDKQPKTKEYDATLTSFSVNFTTSRRIRLSRGGEKMNAVCKLVKNQLVKVSSAFVIIIKSKYSIEMQNILK